ncbi:MAG: glycosyltransferase [Blastocatellia bacterium]|nr:glycosyltransferase [Blastocatellia bacterium]
MLLNLQICLLVLLLLVTINFFTNYLTIKLVLPTLKVESEELLVSVLIPARNEANNITDCLISLQNQTYSNLEILVLDDESTDDTSKQVAKLAETDKRIKLITGQKLPKGWVGKSWACHQLSDVANGDWLLFTDADTRYTPTAISASVVFATKEKADLLSLLPKQLAPTTSTQIMMPLLYFIFYTLFPGFFLSRTKTESISAAIGQFLLFNRSAYQAINGHKSVASSIVEDLDLAKAVKKANKKLVVADGTLLLSCQMYQTLSELWKGFTKNFFASFSYSIIKLIGFIIFNLIIYIWPFIALLIATKTVLFITIFQILLVYLLRIILLKRHSYRIYSVLLHPVAIIVMLAISCNSIYSIISGRGVVWKDRNYQQN